jgi:hypothetical protein
MASASAGRSRHRVRRPCHWPAKEFVRPHLLTEADVGHGMSFVARSGQWPLRSVNALNDAIERVLPKMANRRRVVGWRIIW